jgi:uncharacterized protein (DUF362 family)
MQRRVFIKNTVLATSLVFLPYQKVFSEGSKVKVFEIVGDAENTIKELFNQIGGIKTLINKDIAKSTVLIKPNLCLPHNDLLGTITSTGTVKALCNYLINEGVARIIIADHTLQTADKFEQLDLVTYARSNPKISLMLANEQRFFAPKEVKGQVLKNTELLKVLDKVDYFINVPTAKHHQATHVSLSIKGLMGVIWDRQVFHTEIDLDQAIADLAAFVKPHLNIIDAGRVLLNRGPVGPGPLENAGRIFASHDMLAVDAVVASRYNFGGKSLTAKEIPHLWLSYKNNVGEIDMEKIDISTITV